MCSSKAERPAESVLSVYGAQVSACMCKYMHLNDLRCLTGSFWHQTFLVSWDRCASRHSLPLPDVVPLLSLSLLQGRVPSLAGLPQFQQQCCVREITHSLLGWGENFNLQSLHTFPRSLWTTAAAKNHKHLWGGWRRELCASTGASQGEMTATLLGGRGYGLSAVDYFPPPPFF